MNFHDEKKLTTIEPSNRVMVYETINDVPVPLRANIVVLARKGMPAAEIAARFTLPVLWVKLLVETPPGSTEH